MRPYKADRPRDGQCDRRRRNRFYQPVPEFIFAAQPGNENPSGTSQIASPAKKSAGGTRCWLASAGALISRKRTLF